MYSSRRVTSAQFRSLSMCHSNRYFRLPLLCSPPPFRRCVCLTQILEAGLASIAKKSVHCLETSANLSGWAQMLQLRLGSKCRPGLLPIVRAPQCQMSRGLDTPIMRTHEFQSDSPIPPSDAVRAVYNETKQPRLIAGPELLPILGTGQGGP